MAVAPPGVVGDGGSTKVACEVAVHTAPKPLELLRIRKGREFVGHHEHTMTALMRVGIPNMSEACMRDFKPKMQIVTELTRIRHFHLSGCSSPARGKQQSTGRFTGTAPWHFSRMASPFASASRSIGAG